MDPFSLINWPESPVPAPAELPPTPAPAPAPVSAWTTPTPPWGRASNGFDRGIAPLALHVPTAPFAPVPGLPPTPHSAPPYLSSGCPLPPRDGLRVDLEAMERRMRGLVAAGIRAEEIFVLGSQDNCMEVFECLHRVGPVLRHGGFTQLELLHLASGPEGPHKLVTAFRYAQQLAALGLAPGQSTQVVCSTGGLVALGMLMVMGGHLRQRGFSVAQLVEVASSGDGGDKLRILHNRGPSLAVAGFNFPQLVAVAASQDGAASLDKLSQIHHLFALAGLSTDDQAALAVVPNAAERLSLLSTYVTALVPLKVSKFELLHACTSLRLSVPFLRVWIETRLGAEDEFPQVHALWQHVATGR